MTGSKNWKGRMPSIISLNGSPVKGSSTELLLARIAETIMEFSDYEFRHESIRLHDLKFEFCRACGFSPEPDFCIHHDDYYPVYQKLLDCDIVLFGSPVYFDSVSAQSKTFIDRCNCLRPPDFENTTDEQFKKIIPRKRLGAMVLVGGERGEFEHARVVLAGWFKWLWIENLGRIKYRSPDWKRAGAATGDNNITAQAEKLGQALSARFAEAYARDMG